MSVIVTYLWTCLICGQEWHQEKGTKKRNCPRCHAINVECDPENITEIME